MLWVSYMTWNMMMMLMMTSVASNAKHSLLTFSTSSEDSSQRSRRSISHPTYAHPTDAFGWSARTHRTSKISDLEGLERCEKNQRSIQELRHKIKIKVEEPSPLPWLRPGAKSPYMFFLRWTPQSI